MHTEISVDNNEDTGECRGESGYYALAKKAFNAMPEESREFFFDSSMYNNYEARLLAWAAANGDEFDSTSSIFVTPEGRIHEFDSLSENNNSMIIIIAAIAVTSVMSLSVLLVLRKRKQR